MNAPDRSGTVLAYFASHPEHFTTERHDENRRKSLPLLIAHLEATHTEDRGKWGVLVKTDRNLKIPCDVIVWKVTGEHFDVMDSRGGMWGPHGPISVNGGDAWFWAPPSVVDPNGDERALRPPPYDQPSPDASPQPSPVPTPTPPPVDVGALTARLDTLAGDVAALRTLIQQLLDRPAPSPPAAAPEIRFPRYEGTLDLGPLGNQTVVLTPKTD